MEAIIKNSIIAALKQYINLEGLKQVDLAKLIDWTATDLSDTLNGRKPIGASRQSHLKEKLGERYERLLLKEMINGLKGDLQKYEGLLESVFGNIGGEQSGYSLSVIDEISSGFEKEYVEKLLTILKKKDEGTISAVTKSIDTFIRIPDDPDKA